MTRENRCRPAPGRHVRCAGEQINQGRPGSWKFDALAVPALGDGALAVEQRGIPVDQLVDETLAALHGAHRVARLKQPLEG
ncbi:hypothetical protein [Saccharothrix variisporea]|uniref:Uncharacterized protein n=1 Tax=Saccharothrix variisporea TaxID=543527 RepID=A0A495XMZ5_9PSEU|nr:hypothetical protein [Saccharothrix variisporea]RKT74276.1 hypothetical protein DFJ66_7620 [Saccharothrix variisporea]